MAVFGLPKLREDDALRAVRAAARMQRAQAVLNDELERHWGVRLTVRTGVNTGRVVAGDPTAGQRLVTGDAVNVAARLEQAAGAQEVACSAISPTGSFATSSTSRRWSRSSSGKSEPVRAYRLIDVHGHSGRHVASTHPWWGASASSSSSGVRSPRRSSCDSADSSP